MAGLLLAIPLHAAEGNIKFNGQPAVSVGNIGGAANRAPGDAGNDLRQPGFQRAVMAPVTPEESDKAVLGRTPGVKLNQGVAAPRYSKAQTGVVTTQRISGDAAPLAPTSIAELARALRGNPDLIYEYVRNNIEYLPAWGIQKGEFGALLDNQGSAFDQSALMVALLRQSGYTANFVKGRVNLTAAQVRDWFGVDTANVCGAYSLMGNAQIPVASVTASAAGSCPGSTASLVSMKLEHVWVKVNIGGTFYYFDPSFKPHTQVTGANLATATGYNAVNFMTAATTGATITTDYVQGINRANVRANLTTYANNLTAYLRSNLPAATLDEVIGGKKIVPHNGAALRQASLPYQDTAVALTEWIDVPANYKPTLRIQYAGIDRTFTSDAIYGRRLTITYNGSNQPVLSLNGTALATGTAVTPNTYGSVAMTVTHGAYANTFANQAFTQQIKSSGTFVIGNGWGSAGRGPIELYRSQLDQAITSGAAAGSEPVLGSSLAVLSASWIGQVNHSNYIADRLGRTTTLFHHQIGIAGYNTASYVDLPGNMLSVVSQDGSAAKEAAAFFSASMHSSIFESTAVQQTTKASAVSTVKLLDMAVAAGDRIYDARAANFASAVQPNLVGCSGWTANFQSSINAGRRLILPARCTLTEGSWTGTGYYDILTGTNGSSIGAIIGGGLAGGFATSPQSTFDTTINTFNTTASPAALTPSTGQSRADPIDMTKGHFLYANADITTGVGEFPSSLSFARSYSSSNRTRAGSLGLGWTSSVTANVQTASDGFQGMGEDSGLDAAAAIAEKMVSLDLMADVNKPITNMVVASLGQRWFGEQITDNTVTVSQGTNSDVFVKLVDGTYNSPPGNSAKLTKNADNSYTYETLHKGQLLFGTTGQLTSFTHPSGIQAKYTYSGNLLTQVSNSLGRTLTLTYTGGRVSSVSDGSRSVSFGYDASGNLSSFTNALTAVTTYQYDLPGRMTKVFYPANPTNASVSNVYDSLGRVQTQTDALGRLYTYFFAGSRSEEIGPYNQSNVSYVDANGRVLAQVDPLGAIVRHTYDGHTRLVQTVLPAGNSIAYTYDDAPCAAQKRCTHNIKTVRQVAKPGSGLADEISSFTYESTFNNLASSTDPRLQTTSFTYNAQGSPLTVTAPVDSTGAAPVTTFGYTGFVASGFPTFYLPTSTARKISPTLTSTDTTSYNTANKYVPQTSVSDSGGLNRTTTFAYDTVGNQITVDGPRTDVVDVTSTTYDAERRPLQITDALSKVTRHFYDADGRLVRVAGQLGTQWLVTCNTYSLRGKLTRTWGAALTASDSACPAAVAPVPVVDFAYDELDRQVRVTESLAAAEGGNRVRETAYYLDNTVQSTSRAVGSAAAQVYAAYTYTVTGKQATVKDANNNLTSYEYDGHDRLVKTRYPDKTVANTSSTTDVETSAYDKNGNVTTQVRRNGQVTTMAYDNLNRLISRTYPDSADNVAFQYDLLARMLAAKYVNAAHDLTWTYDNTGHPLSATAGAKTISYQYDGNGNRVRTTWPDAFYVTTSFDALNRPSAIKEQGTVSLAVYGYDDRSRRATVTLGNGTTTSYSYSPQFSLAGLSHNLAGTAQDAAWTYNRNQAQDITTQSWTNDLYQWNGSVNGTRGYTSNGLNQYTAVAGTALTYDGNGNVSGDGLWTYAYDAANRLKSASKAGVAASLSYDALNRLRQSVINGATLNQLYSDTSLIGEFDGAGTLLRRYVPGPGVDDVLVQYDGAGTASKTWLYADHLGSVVAGADSTGTATGTFTYGPYGEPDTATGPRFRYTGQQYFGELGLSYYKARFYSASLGRFLQTDGIGYAADLNLYAYVKNNPINSIDPTGLADLILFSPVGKDAGMYSAALRVLSPANTFTVSGHGHPSTMIGQNGRPIEAAVLARTIWEHPAYNPTMDVQLQACNVGLNRSPGVPSYAAQVQTELARLGAKGTVQGANSFVWYPSDGKTYVAPDKGGVTWQTLTHENESQLTPDKSHLGGYNTFGTRAEEPVSWWAKVFGKPGKGG